MTITQSPSVQNAALAADILASIGVPARESFTVQTPDNAFESGRVVSFDALQFAGNAPVESLSDHAVRCPDPGRTPADGIRRFIAPDVCSDKHGFVEYALYNYADKPRAAGADFPTLRHPSYQLVTQRIVNRGLAVEVDEDAEPLEGDWPQGKVAFLRGALDRARLRRTVRLFVAGAVNVHKTWSTPPSNPDMDIIDELDAQTLRASRVLYGPGAWAVRAHCSGDDASMRKSPEELAGEFAVEEVRVIRAEDAADTAGIPCRAGRQVLLFCAADHLGRNDFSNLKTFTAPAKTGERYAAYLRRIGGKRWRVAVECYETVAITSTVGLGVVTVD